MSTSEDVLEAIDNAVEDWETSGDAMRWTPEVPDIYAALGPERMAALQHAFRQVSVTVRVMVRQYTRAFGRMAHRLHRLHAAQHPKEHLRCRTCRPHANPAPLCIDGHEYNRRRRRRKR